MSETSITEILKRRRNRIAAIEEAVDDSPIPISMWVTHAQIALALARGWLGKALQAIGEKYPYPNGNDATTEKIDPPAYDAGAAIELDPSPIKSIKILRSAIGAVADEMLADDLFGPMHGGAWGWNCQRRSVDHLVEARLLLGEALGAMQVPAATPRA